MVRHFLFVRILNKISQIMKDHNCSVNFEQKFNCFKHQRIENSIYKYLFKSYKMLNNPFYSGDKFNSIIWMFWWQGYNNMPPIVDDCIESVCNNLNGYTFIFITKYNVRRYTNIPEYIYHKVHDGNITLTEFSDILRYNLLKNYGGIWIDSTIFCSSNLDYNALQKNKLIVTSGCSDIYHFFVCNKWTESFIGGYMDSSLFVFMSNFFNLYWKYNMHLITYNLVDYALYFAYVYNIGDFHFYIDKNARINNPKMFKLVKYMNKPYSSNVYNHITSNTHLFKLTYKMHFLNNANTFYNKLIE